MSGSRPLPIFLRPRGAIIQRSIKSHHIGDFVLSVICGSEIEKDYVALD